MNYDQGDLLTELRHAPAQVVNLAAPRCNMCARPARWLTDRQVYASYCAGRNCDNRERICQSVGCGKTFKLNVGGAGTKYCSTACKANGYHPERNRRACEECGKVMSSHLRDKSWSVCSECRYPLRFVIDTLRSHHVSWQQARSLLADSGCQICGVEVVGRQITSQGGWIRSALAIDHDHRCCPGVKSCGACVRGFLCGPCNTAIGLLREDADVLRRAADYLGRAATRADGYVE